MVPFSIIFVGEFCVTIYTMQIPGIFIIVKDKESSLEQFNKLKERYGNSLILR